MFDVSTHPAHSADQEQSYSFTFHLDTPSEIYLSENVRLSGWIVSEEPIRLLIQAEGVTRIKSLNVVRKDALRPRTALHALSTSDELNGFDYLSPASGRIEIGVLIGSERIWIYTLERKKGSCDAGDLQASGIQPESIKKIKIMPYIRPWIGGPDLSCIPFHGRIIHSGNFLDQHHEKEERDPALCNGRWLYGGPYYNHFGHILQDTIPRLWAFNKNIHKGIIFPLVGNSTPASYFFDILRYLNIKEEDCFFLSQDTVFETVDFAPPGNFPHFSAERWYLEFLSGITIKKNTDLPNRVYLGRTHIIKKGTFLGESYFSKKLEAAGFSSIKPEEMSIKDQLSLIKYAKTIVFTEGSSIFSAALISHLEGCVFMLPRRPGGFNYFGRWLASRGKFEVLGDGEIKLLPDAQEKISPNSPSLLANPLSTFEDLKKLGFLSGEFSSNEYGAYEVYDGLNYFDGNIQKVSKCCEK